MAKSSVTAVHWRYENGLSLAIVLAACLQVGLVFEIARIHPVMGYSYLKLCIVRLAIMAPVFYIWWLAARSARRFKNYALSILDSADGHAINYIADGLLLLVAYIVVLNFVNPLESLFAYSRHIRLVVPLVNHGPVLVALAAALKLFIGSTQLARLTDKVVWTSRRLALMAVPFVACMVIFGTDFYMQSPKLYTPEGVPRFAFPRAALLATYVLPHMVVWLLGLMATINLSWYSRRVEGSIYRRLFRQANRGLVLIFISIFIAQLLIISPLVVTHFNLGVVLIYALIVIAITGYTLLYKGAAKLQNIENVS